MYFRSSLKYVFRHVTRFYMTHQNSFNRIEHPVWIISKVQRRKPRIGD